MEPKKQFIIFTGLQASGKSTYYKTHFVDTHVYVNLDTLKTRPREKRLIEESVAQSLQIVVDNTNPTPETRKPYIDIAKANGYEVISYFFRTPIGTCKRNNESRERKVPSVALYATLKKMVQPSFKEGFDKIITISFEYSKNYDEDWLRRRNDDRGADQV